MPSGLECYESLFPNETSSCLQACEGIFADVLKTDFYGPEGVEDMNWTRTLGKDWNNFKTQAFTNIELDIVDCNAKKHFFCKYTLLEF